MPNTEPMTQRVELATVRDRLAVDGLITDYAVAVDDGDWEAYRELFAPRGRADYRSAGGIEGEARAVAAWLAESLRLFPMRQHLIVNRRVRRTPATRPRCRPTTSIPWPPRGPLRTSCAVAGTPSRRCARTTAGG